MNQRLAWPRRTLAGIRDALDPLSKLATILAVVIAAIWTYHIHEITGESDDNPQMTLSTQVLEYNQDERLLVVHVRDKNVGKIPIPLAKDSLTVTVKRIPDTLKPGHVDMGKQPALFVDKSLEETDLEPAVEQDDLREFVISPGLYYVEGTLDLPDGDFINDAAVASVP